MKLKPASAISTAQNHLNSREKSLTKKSAFTLLEILLVIVIITVVAGVAISQLNPIAEIDRTRRDTTGIKIQQLTTVVRRYAMDVGSLPPNLDALVTDPGVTNWRGPYSSSVPTDAWGTPFIYSASGREFEIRSDADGTDGGPISSNDFR